MTKITYAQAAEAFAAATELSKIGSKEGSVVKRLWRILRWCRKAGEDLEGQRKLLVESEALKENGQFVVKTTPDGRQDYDIPNRVELTRKLSAFINAEVETEEQPPRAFTWEEATTKFKEMPDPALLERLGPFIEAPTGDE
jgi:hypothetical protein